MIPASPPVPAPAFPCLVRQHVPNPRVGYPALTMFVVVVRSARGVEYRGDLPRVEGRSGYPAAPAYPACKPAATKQLGVLFVGAK